MTRTFHWLKRRFPKVQTSTTQCLPKTPETPSNASLLPGALQALAIDELSIHANVLSWNDAVQLSRAGRPNSFYVSWQPEPAGTTGKCDGICGTNFRLANKLLDARLLTGWQSWAMNATSFLYWGVGQWFDWAMHRGSHVPHLAPIDANARGLPGPPPLPPNSNSSTYHQESSHVRPPVCI